MRRMGRDRGGWKGEGKETRRGHGTTLLNVVPPVRVLAVGSKTDLESRIMPRPCWNFWGPYWPHQSAVCIRSSKSRARQGNGMNLALGALSRYPTTPHSECRGSRGTSMEKPQYVHQGREYESSSPSPPRLLPRSHPRRNPPRGFSLSLSFLASPYIPVRSDSLPSRPRNVGDNPRRLVRIFLGPYYYCRGSTQMVSRVWAGSPAPRKEVLSSHLPPSLPRSFFTACRLILLFFLLLFCRHDRLTTDLRFAHSFSSLNGLFSFVFFFCFSRGGFVDFPRKSLRPLSHPRGHSMRSPSFTISLCFGFVFSFICIVSAPEQRGL